MRATMIGTLAMVLGFGTLAPAQTFTRIADSSTAIPNGTGSFTGFDAGASVSGSTVAFRGSGASGQLGFYSASTSGGSLNRIVDLTIAQPNGSGNFTNFGAAFGLSGATFAFAGIGNPSATGVVQVGIYTAPAGGGAIAVISDPNTPIPNGTGNFRNFGDVAISSSVAAFYGNSPSPSQEGIYHGSAAGGSLNRLADLNTPIPNGTGSFTQFGVINQSIFGTTIGFRGAGANGQNGLYTGSTSNGTMTRIADLNTSIPGSTGTFTNFAQQHVFSSGVAFHGTGSGGLTGIYVGTHNGEQTIRIADTNMAIPNGSGNFSGFSQATTNAVSYRLTASGNTIVFRGTGENNQVGLYAGTTDGNPLFKIVAAGDSLDGKTVSDVALNKNGLDNSILAFSVSFTDGTAGVYVTFLPVPEPAAVLGLAALSLGATPLGRRFGIRVRRS